MKGRPAIGEPVSEHRPEPSPTSPVATSKKQLIVALLLGVVIGVVALWFYQGMQYWGEHIFSYDINEDGRTDEVWVYRNGQTVSLKRDDNRDGVMDYWGFYEEGILVRYEGDRNRDGKLDFWATYDEAGLSSTERVDTDFNGVADGIVYYHYDQIVRVDWQPNGAANVIRRDLYQHEVYTEELHDLDGDGMFDISIRFDFIGNPISTNPVLQSLQAPR